MKRIIIFFVILVLFSCGSSRLKRGDDAMEEGNYVEAIRGYQEFIDNNPGAPEIEEAKEKIALCYYRIGLHHYERGEIPEAIENFVKSKTRAAYMKLTDIYFDLGNKYLEKKEYKKAAANYELAKETAEEGRVALPSGIKTKIAKTYYLWAEDEMKEDKARAKTHLEIIEKEYDKDTFEKYSQVLYYLFQISYFEGNYESALSYLGRLREIEPEFKFTDEDRKAFSKILAKYTKDADTEFKKKNYDTAYQILEKASVLPNFDPMKQKQLKARIIFEEGKDLLEAGRYDDALKKFAEAREIDINIGTEVINLSKRYIKTGLYLQRRRKYEEAINKFILALKLTPDNKDITSKYLPDTYYRWGNSLYLKRKYKECLEAIKKGLGYNKEHKNLKLLYKRWDRRVNALKKRTEKELTRIMNFIEEQYKNAVADELILGKYKGKRIKWQAKVLGMEESGGKSYGKFKLANIAFYGLPSEKLDAQRFATACEENAKKKMEAIIKGKIIYIEELLGIKHLVVEISSIKFVEPLE